MNEAQNFNIIHLQRDRYWKFKQKRYGMHVYNQQRRRLENLHLPVKVVCQDSFKKLTSRAVIIICSNEMQHEPIYPKRWQPHRTKEA